MRNHFYHDASTSERLCDRGVSELLISQCHQASSQRGTCVVLCLCCTLRSRLVHQKKSNITSACRISGVSRHAQTEVKAVKFSINQPVVPSVHSLVSAKRKVLKSATSFFSQERKICLETEHTTHTRTQTYTHTHIHTYIHTRDSEVLLP